MNNERTKTTKKKKPPKCKRWPECSCILQGRIGTDCPKPEVYTI